MTTPHDDARDLAPYEGTAGSTGQGATTEPIPSAWQASAGSYSPEPEPRIDWTQPANGGARHAEPAYLVDSSGWEEPALAEEP